MHIPDYQVCVSSPYNGGTLGLYPVQEWKVKGGTLVPIYDNGMTPQDEPPQNTVTLLDMTGAFGPVCDETVRAEGQNNVLVCSLAAGHEGRHHLVSY